MKKILVAALFVALFNGCNINESKEARIQKLEAEISRASSKIQELENRTQVLESVSSEKSN